ncbi:MAG TPA: VIT domain-containing protein [Kofleriaceae bacterium]|nr:VIT domain-containing protein [Kofleriaceae bacterium]
MDEAPPVGGELRLAKPVWSTPPDGPRQQVIAFPLRHTDVHARVAGMMAQYTVEQTFENPFDEPIEAVYVFPLGDEAAVSGYKIKIGERTISGEIQTRDQARTTYEHAKSEGHTAALIEQDKNNVFEQRIANIAPHEAVVVSIEYTELLAYDNGQYEMDVPLVVGPRYLPASSTDAHPIAAKRVGGADRAGATTIPYVDGTVLGSTVSFTAEIDAGVPLGPITSPSHDLDEHAIGPTRTQVTLRREDELPNRDLILRYRVAGEKTMVGVLANRSNGDDGFFVLEVQPKGSFREGEITPREVVILIDTSGSMDGQPIGQAQRLAGRLIDSLGPRDTFDILGFAGSVSAMAPQPVGSDLAGKARGHAFVQSLSSGGGTEMQAGVLEALRVDPGDDRIREVYLLTDGFIGNDDQIVGAAKGALGKSRIFPVGIGSAPNRGLLDRLASVGRGFPSYLNLTENADDVAADIVAKSGHPYLTDVAIDWGGLDVHDLTPAVIPDVFAGQPLVIAGRYGGPGVATVTVSAFNSGHRVSIPVTVTLPFKNDLPPVASLWARRRIDELTSEKLDGKDTDDQIQALGLKFHLVTELTSFVAVDRTRVVVPGGASKTVQQPAAVPAGVNIDTAVGPQPSYNSSGYSGGGGGDYDGDSGGGGGGWGGGDVDLIAIGLGLALLIRRLR